MERQRTILCPKEGYFGVVLVRDGAEEGTYADVYSQQCVVAVAKLRLFSIFLLSQLFLFCQLSFLSQKLQTKTYLPHGIHRNPTLKCIQRNALNFKDKVIIRRQYHAFLITPKSLSQSTSMVWKRQTLDLWTSSVTHLFIDHTKNLTDILLSFFCHILSYHIFIYI